MCVVLDSLSSAVAAVQSLPSPVGLGAADALAVQVEALSGAVASLQRQLAVRMAAWERQSTEPADTRGTAARAGVQDSQAALLRRLGAFAAEHDRLRAAWLAGRVSTDHVAALAKGARALPTPALREQLVEALLPHLPGLTAAQARRLVEFTIDQLDPGDPDADERRDHDHRSLVWSRSGGGLTFQGYLPGLEAGAFTAAIGALVASMRVEGDGHTTAQRQADALAQLVAIAGAHGLPTGGGLPAAVTITVSLEEAARVAAKDPAAHGLDIELRPRGGARIGGARGGAWGGAWAGDAAARFGLCCAQITPVLTGAPAPAGLLGRIAATPAEPLAAGRSVRLATPAQRKALQLRDGGCVITGCQIAAPHTQPHHVVPWSIDGPTDLSNLASLCHVHHRQVELGHWTLIRREPGEPRPDLALEHPNWWILPRVR